MRKALWIIPAAVLFTLGTTIARADSLSANSVPASASVSATTFSASSTAADPFAKVASNNMMFFLNGGGGPTVPEPASVALMLVGLGSLAFAMRKRIANGLQGAN